MRVGRKKPLEDAGDSASTVLLCKCTPITYSIKWAQLRWARTLQPEKGRIYWKYERSTQIWVAWRGILEISWLLYFSDTDHKELDMILIWTRLKMKKRMWFFMRQAVDLWNSLPKDAVYRWRQSGQVLGKEFRWHLLTGLLIVLGSGSLLVWKLLDHIRSLFFLFPTCPLVTCSWRQNTEQGRHLLWDSVMFFLVLCSYIPFIFFKCYRNGLNFRLKFYLCGWCWWFPY